MELQEMHTYEKIQLRTMKIQSLDGYPSGALVMWANLMCNLNEFTPHIWKSVEGDRYCEWLWPYLIAIFSVPKGSNE